MSTQDIEDFAKTLTVPECLSLVDEEKFNNLNRGDQRLGQAFFNAMTEEGQATLRGSLYDPFYKDNWRAIALAVAFFASR